MSSSASLLKHLGGRLYPLGASYVLIGQMDVHQRACNRLGGVTTHARRHTRVCARSGTVHVYMRARVCAYATLTHTHVGMHTDACMHGTRVHTQNSYYDTTDLRGGTEGQKKCFVGQQVPPLWCPGWTREKMPLNPPWS